MLYFLTQLYLVITFASTVLNFLLWYSLITLQVFLKALNSFLCSESESKVVSIMSDFITHGPSHQLILSMGFSRQECWSELLLSSPFWRIVKVDIRALSWQLFALSTWTCHLPIFDSDERSAVTMLGVPKKCRSLFLYCSNLSAFELTNSSPAMTKGTWTTFSS